MTTVTIELTEGEERFCRSYQSAPDTYGTLQGVICAKIRKALPQEFTVGDFVSVKGGIADYTKRMEVIAVRGDRVYLIDGDGDACSYRSASLEKVQ